MNDAQIIEVAKRHLKEEVHEGLSVVKASRTATYAKIRVPKSPGIKTAHVMKEQETKDQRYSVYGTLTVPFKE